MHLHTKSKLFSIHKKMKILNDENKTVYEVESKAISIHDTTYIRDEHNRQVAVLTCKPISMHETHLIEMASGEQIEIKTELFHLMEDVIRIDALGWELHGDLLQHDYQLVDMNGQVIAATHHKWVSLHDTYDIEVADEGDMDRIISVYVTLEKIIRSREQRRMNHD